MNKTLRNIILFSIVTISVVMHFNDFSRDLISIHTWRQTQTQSNIINFYEEDMNILNPRRNDRGDTDGIYRMEFPLMQWIVASLYKAFGNHLIITRIFMFIIGLLSVLGMYKLLFALFHNITLSVIGAWAFNFSPTFYFYTISPFPDNLALCCAIWGLALFFIWLNNNKQYILILSGLLLSIGALCKLPFITFFVIPFIYFMIQLRKEGFNYRIIGQGFSALIFSILPLAWYLTVIPSWQSDVIVKGILNQNSTPMQILDYLQSNLISTLPELLLNYGSLLFFLAGFYFLIKKKSHKDPRFNLILSLCIVLILYYLYEVTAIAKSHDYYLYPFFPLLFILVSYGAFNLLKSKVTFIRYLTIILLILLPLFCFLRLQSRMNPDSPGFNKDLLIYKNELREAVPKDALVVAGNDNSHCIFFYYIDKKGWAFNKDNLTSQNLQKMIEQGAKYLYTDSRKIDSNSEIFSYMDALILEKGTIKIYRLKKSAANNL